MGEPESQGELPYVAMPDLDSNADAILIQTIKLENEGWERDEGVTEPSEPSL